VEKDTKEGELRMKLRDARGALATRERQLAGAQRALQRLAEEKSRFQVRCILHKLSGCIRVGLLDFA
jgi:hypothetical protein